jgi:ribonuclease P protein component
MDHEKNLPGQQNSPQKNFRIPRTHGNAGRPQRNPQTQTSEPQGSVCLDFPKNARLRKRRDYLRMQKVGRRLVGRLCCIDVASNSHPCPRLGISASTRYGDSPTRNRFKRIAREAFRKIAPELPASLDLHVVPRPLAKKVSSLDLEKEFLTLLSKLYSFQLKGTGED